MFIVSGPGMDAHCDTVCKAPLGSAMFIVTVPLRGHQAPERHSSWSQRASRYAPRQSQGTLEKDGSISLTPRFSGVASVSWSFLTVSIQRFSLCLPGRPERSWARPLINRKLPLLGSVNSAAVLAVGSAILQGLRPPAQGCEERANLGWRTKQAEP